MTSETKYVPKEGEIVVVGSIPDCNFCMNGTPGPYDFATWMGPWANGCERHWIAYRVGLLGMGVGQLWITIDQVADSEPPTLEQTLAARVRAFDDAHGS